MFRESIFHSFPPLDATVSAGHLIIERRRYSVDVSCVPLIHTHVYKYVFHASSKNKRSHARGGLKEYVQLYFYGILDFERYVYFREIFYYDVTLHSLIFHAMCVSVLSKYLRYKSSETLYALFQTQFQEISKQSTITIKDND